MFSSSTRVSITKVYQTTISTDVYTHHGLFRPLHYVYITAKKKKKKKKKKKERERGSKNENQSRLGG